MQPFADYIIATPYLMTSEENPLIPALVRNMHQNTDFEAAAKQAVLDAEKLMYQGFLKEDLEGMNGNLELIRSAALPAVCHAAAKLSKRLCDLYASQKEKIDRATDRVFRFYNREAFGQAIVEQITIDLQKNPSLPSYSLSIQLCDKDAYNKPIAGTGFNVRDVYEYSDFNIFTGWGDWLETNEHQPTGNPCGQVR